MKNILRAAMISALGLGFAACEGSKDNPKTVSRTDLQPPGFLYTATGDASIELRWSAANVEDDFKGYYVFGTTGTMEDLAAKVVFPSKDVDVATNSLNRCKDNSALFEVFGMPATEVACEDDTAEEETGSDDASLALLQDGETEEGTDEEKEPKLENFLVCTNHNDATISVPHKEEKDVATSLQYCNVDKVWDVEKGEKVAIANGTKVTFVVFAVSGDDMDTISWSSNLVEDAAAAEVSEKINAIELSESGKYRELTFTVGEAPSVTVGDEKSCTTANDKKNLCRVSNVNESVNDGYMLYIARDVRGSTATTDDSKKSFAQRVFISPAKDSKMALRIVNRSCDLDKDATCSEIAKRVPGDVPTGKDDFTADGVVLTLYGGEVIDMRFEGEGGSYYYGKLIVNSITPAKAGSPTDKVTVDMVAVIQQGANVAYYLR